MSKRESLDVDGTALLPMASNISSPLAVQTTFDDGKAIFIKKGFASGSVEHEEENLDSIPGIEASSTGATTPTSTTSGAASVSIGENQLVSPSEESTLAIQSPSSMVGTYDDNGDIQMGAPKSDENNEKAATGDDDIYVSKEDLVLLLPTETYEEYERLVEQERDQKRSDRSLRRQMIQQELDTLLRLMEENEMEDGQALEVEAEEALGIAANRVCYKQKYYDVAKSEYVFVPSVAYTVMDGSLLDEASKHYYGQSEEFLIAYAAALGSAVLSQKKHNEYLHVGQKNKELLEEIDLAEKTPKMNCQKNETVSDLFLGVSPRNVDKKDWDVAGFLESTKNQTTVEPSKRLTKKQMKKLKLAVGVYCALAALFSVLVLFVAPQSHDWGAAMDIEQAPLFKLFKPSSYLMPSIDLLKLSTSRYVLSESQDGGNAMRMLPGKEVDAAVAPARPRVVISKRPIAANLFVPPLGLLTVEVEPLHFQFYFQRQAGGSRES